MKEWILSIIGCVFLGVLLDVIYPNGKTNSFCKSIFSIIVLMIIIKPIINFEFENEESESFINSSIVENIYNSRIESIKNQIEYTLKLNNIECVDVEIYGNMSSNEFNIDNIYVDTSSIVLSENFENINKYEVILKVITDVTNIDAEKVIIYG